MKLLKLVLLFALCFAALGQRSIGFQIDAIGIAKQKDLAPYLKVSIEDSIYIVALESLYEVYLDNSTNQWMKDFTTETHFESLKWNETISLLNGTFELLGAPCPCNNTQEGEEGVEPFNITTRGRQQLRDVLEDIKCQVPPFDFVMLGMQYIANNESSCESVDISLCNNQCTQACQNNSNPENCALGCGAITNGTIIDTIDCNTTCNQAGANGTADADCMFACMNTASCIAGNASCRLDLQYQLNSFQWSNSSGDSPRKLAFAFQIVPEPDEGEECGTEFVTWLEGPFFLWIDTTTLALDLPNLMDLSNVDLSSAVEVPSSVSFAPGASSVTGRLYIDPFTTGHSIFNNRQVGTH